MKLHIITAFLAIIAFCAPSVTGAVPVELSSVVNAPAVVSASVDSDKEFKVEGSTGMIIIKSTAEKETTCRIYSITGQLLATVKVAPASTSKTEINAGCYIVKTPSSTRKVMVK
ncbi:MAG: T9SS type A sorting domain-containing protein [Paramuribaculum sp.]|nr:T9SS type A sorting domain-containing protein [Paramuribaculum sp.]